MLTPRETHELAREIAKAVAAELDARENRPSLIDGHTLASRLMVSVSSIERWERAGIIPVIRIGQVKRYDLAAVLAALQNVEAVA